MASPANKRIGGIGSHVPTHVQEIVLGKGRTDVFIIILFVREKEEKEKKARTWQRTS